MEGTWENTAQIKNWILAEKIPTSYKRLYIYGCEFAKGKAGREAVRYLAQGTAAGTYDLQYRICLAADNAICDTGVARIVVNSCVVTKAPITVIKN